MRRKTLHILGASVQQSFIEGPGEPQEVSLESRTFFRREVAIDRVNLFPECGLCVPKISVLFDEGTHT